MPDRVDWAGMWAAYDESTYQAALDFIEPGSFILDIGAGDLRLAGRAVNKGCTVFAIELQPAVIRQARPDVLNLEQLYIVAADARLIPFPPGLDAALLLMRHCEDYALYVGKLRACGCPKLITNARWRMGVECIPLKPGEAFKADRVGWYACVRCGATAFIPVQDERSQCDRLNPGIDLDYVNVEGCPHCLPT
jgi:hypothetical protein